ncbi:hypothetical protein GCM10010381_30510 [Streptomyces xantholiticus]|nr:hypothetical protein GCM10010381_30510 [Streptomyces xantholiticus]
MDLLSVRAAYAPLLAPVWASNPADTTRVGMSLRVTFRIERGAAGTSQARQIRRERRPSAVLEVGGKGFVTAGRRLPGDRRDGGPAVTGATRPARPS